MRRFEGKAVVIAGAASLVCGASDLDLILTDKGIDDETLAVLRDGGVDVAAC